MKTQIDTLRKLNEELDSIKDQHSVLIGQIKEQAKNNKVLVTRKGQEVEITEKDLFDELYWGAETDALDILKAKYPLLFELEEQSIQKAKEIKLYSVKEFGFSPEKMNLTNLIDLIIKINKYKDEE